MPVDTENNQQSLQVSSLTVREDTHSLQCACCLFAEFEEKERVEDLQSNVCFV
jgi:hypothetical protein